MLSTADTFATRILPAGEKAIEAAGERIRQGALVAFPTETVYGLGGNALDERAVAAIFGVKARPRINPLIVHVPNIGQAEKLVVFEGHAHALAEAFWPGPLTLVLPRRESAALADLVSAGLATAAVRVPAHPIARRLLEAAGVPVAAPSANRSGRLSPTTAAHVSEELGGHIEMILDGGPCQVGLESTIIGFEHGCPVLLRSGAIERQAIEALVGPLSDYAGKGLAAPGMMQSHYAPRTAMRLNAGDVETGECLLAFGPAPIPSEGVVRNLSPSGDLKEAAANLFRMLRELDAAGLSRIAVMPIPQTGLGEAINDRLARAAAPREV